MTIDLQGPPRAASLEVPAWDTAPSVLAKGRAFLESLGYEVVSFDDRRPWGGFLVIAEDQARRFIGAFFPGADLNDFGSGVRLSPKLLAVAPGTRLSWQYHRRRSEIWRVLSGRVGVVRSPDDRARPALELSAGDQVSLGVGERHRLVGLGGWGIVAEVWRHAEPEHPSSEDDIVRVSDDYGR